MNVESIVQGARSRTGLSLNEFSRKSHIDKSSLSLIENARRDPSLNTADRILTAAGTQVFAAPLRRADVASLAQLIHDSEFEGDFQTSYRAFIQVADNLAGEHGIRRLLVALNEPTRISPEWDDALAALAEWRLTEEGLPLPEWIATRPGNPNRRWAPKVTADGWRSPASEERIPDPLKSRGIWIEADELTSV